MKYNKLKKTIFFILCALCLCTAIDAEAKEKTKKIGNYKYTYTDYNSSSLWIVGITPTSNKGIKTLKIPAYIDGKKVVKLGNQYDNEEHYSASNVFGMLRSEEDWSLQPRKTAKRVKKIGKIILPETVNEITPHAFSEVQDGKTIHIPSGLIKNVVRLRGTKWKKFTVSSKNKKYKAKNNLLMSKNGKTVYGYVGSGKKVVIPEGVKTIGKTAFSSNDITDITIPKSVSKIKNQAFSYIESLTIHISAKNKYYGLASNCIYSKRSGRLVAAIAQGGIITIPETVTCLKNGTSFIGGTVKKIIFPKSLKSIRNYWNISLRYDGTMQSVFLGKNPPVFEEDAAFPSGKVYVPKGTKAKYQKIVGSESNPIYEM